MICDVDFKTLINCENRSDLLLEKIDSSILSYSKFFENYLLLNKPCILSKISNNWPCSLEWVKDGKPNFEFLTEKYANFEVTVSDCHSKKYNAHITQEMKFKDYIIYWKKLIENNYNSEELGLLYLKDFHLRNCTKDSFYVVPQYFSSDWLNEFFSETTSDDYRFVYMGPKGTWTPFHVDVFTSFSWSVNICGKKKWLLFPPGEEEFLKDNLGNLPFNVETINHNRKYYEIIQEPGDALFVPSGWHHQVTNLEDTISINHNWVNSCNIFNMWNSLIENLTKVKLEIADCKEMDGWLEHCQLMLKTSFGIDFFMFYQFLKHIADKRLKMLEGNLLEIRQFDNWLLGKNHAIFDLLKIKDVLNLFKQHSDFNHLNFNNKIVSDSSPNELLLIIETVLTNIT